MNGGISMWLPRFADLLVEQGIEGYFIWRASLPAQPRNLGENLHFLMQGVKAKKTALENAIAKLREPYQEILALSARYKRCIDALEQAERKWYTAAEIAKTQLEV